MAIRFEKLEPQVEHQLQYSQRKPLEGISQVFFNPGRNFWPITQQTIRSRIRLQHRGRQHRTCFSSVCGKV